MNAAGNSRITSLFYRLPRLTILAVGFILVMGGFSLANLPRQEDPTMTERFGMIETFFPGATASRVETLVTEPLENILREVPEVKKIESLSRPGYSLITPELDDSVSKDMVDLVWTEIRDKVAEVEANLPEGASPPLIESKGPVGDTLAIAIISRDTPIAILERIAEELQSRLASMPGTKETKILGAPEQQILVDVDPFLMARTNVSILDLSRAIRDSDTKTPSGLISSRRNEVMVEVKGDLSGTERISGIPVRQLQGEGFVRVGDIARVTKRYADPPNSMAIVNGERAIVVTTTMETGRRIDRWVARVKSVVDAYDEELPDMVELVTVIDQNTYTEERLTQLFYNLLLAVGLVILSLLVLMGIRSALIVGSALPLSVAMVLGGLSFMDIPLHQMSVIGLIIALGLLIDNAIVVVEEYKLQRRRGNSYGTAIDQSVSHLAIPLLASTATTAFAFLPIATTPGGVGDFTGTMAICVVLSVSSSFILALTIIPSIAAFVDERWPMEKHGEDAPWWINGVNSRTLSSLYRRSLIAIIERPWKGILFSLCLPVAGFLLVGTLTLSFFPPTDRNQFQVQLHLPAGASILATEQATRKLKSIIDSRPEVVSSQWFIGESPPRVYYNMLANNDGVANFAGGFVTTRDVDDPRQILRPLQQELMDAFPEARVMALPFEQGPPFSAPIEVRVVGPNLSTLKTIGDEIRLLLSSVEGVTYTTATLAQSAPQLSVYPNENMANFLGLANRDLPGQINSELSGTIAGTVMEDTAEIPVRVRYDAAMRTDIAMLESAPLQSSRNAGGYGGIALGQLADISLEPSPNRIVRHQGERTNVVSGFLLPYTIPSVPLDEFRQKLEASGVSLPKGYRIEFGGEAEERGEAVGNIISTSVMYLWLMVAVIVLSLNSFRYAGIIGSVGLLSVGLAFFGVWLSGYPMGYMAFIGTLGLVGLSINGAIIVLSALKASTGANEGDVAQTVEVVADATRHIVSTTFTTIGGFIPLILFGGHFWPPLAMAIAGGVAGSAILSLYLVPAMFSRYVKADLARTGRGAASVRYCSLNR